MEKHYYSFSDEMQSLFGEKVYKLSLDGGMTCPNRDGTLGTGGCIFCADGSGEFSARGKDIEQQLEEAKKRVAFKAKSGKYLAYFQSYTNTYAPLSYLRELYERVMDRPEIVGLSIGTRPDCLEQDKVEYLAALSDRKPVWVELGLQTIHDRTAKLIRRGYSLPVFEDAVKRLRQAGIRVVVHVILGLPGESKEDTLETVNYVGHCGVQGIKLQLLHVLRGTLLEEMYNRGEVPVFSLDDYVSLLGDAVELLPPEMVIHRLTGDGAKRLLVAPVWSADKKKVLARIQAEFQIRDIRQGRFYQP